MVAEDFSKTFEFYRRHFVRLCLTHANSSIARPEHRMRTVVSLLALSLTTAIAAPAFADCPECPQVELSQDGERLRVESQDDADPADVLQHRLRLRTGATASAWSDWSSATEYEIAPGARGVIEGQTVDSEGFVGIAAIEWADPNIDPIGPGERRESSDIDTEWSGEAIEPGEAMTEEIPAPVRPSTQMADFDHGECPPEPDTTCSAVRSKRTGTAWPLIALALGMIGLRRRS